MKASRIGDYAIIGNCRAACLVSREGSIDWLCWPRFDSDALFAGLLDPLDGGRWTIQPQAEFSSHHHYVEETNVLVTTFDVPSGRARLVDLMPVASEAEKRRRLFPENEILRVVTCEEGEVEIEVIFDPRPRFGQRTAKLQDGGALGLRMYIGNALLTLRSPMRWTMRGDGAAVARATVRVGEKLDFSLTYSEDAPAVLPSLGARSDEAIATTVRWWRDWASQLDYDGPYRDEVLRSALALKLLIYAPSGAVVAAATTSLPEQLGGNLNWDYRFAWLRDAAFTLRALHRLGFRNEAERFVDWLLHSTRLTRPELRILYDVHGEVPREERELVHLSGYRGSRPVRSGNAAVTQLQLDVYGQVIDAVAALHREGRAMDRETQKMLVDFGTYVCRTWRQPDAGIWEVRGGRQHFTESKMLCWVALDRLLELHARGVLKKIPREDFEKNRALLREAIDGRAWSSELKSFTTTLDGEDVDAAALLLAWFGYAEADSSRMRDTFRAIKERLGAGDGLLYRNRDYDEGAFGICSFWAAEFLARGGGSLDDAERLFERLLGYANEVGLYAEEIDPHTGEALGNFPQAFTRVGLINAALSIADRMKSERAHVQRADRVPRNDALEQEARR